MTVTNVRVEEQADQASKIRALIETAVSDLLHQSRTEGSVDLRRESRRVFEDSCLEEVLWESFIDEWRDVALELAGHDIPYCEFYALTDWCKCGHSHDDHHLDCENCDCERFDRSRAAKRPKQRVRSGRVNPVHANRTACIELENARYRHLFGDLTGGAL